MAKDPKTKKQPKKYIIYDSARESSFGYWILPLITLIVIGCGYIYLRLALDFDDTATTKKSEKILIEDTTINEDLLDSRKRSGLPLNFQELKWGKVNPFE